MIEPSPGFMKHSVDCGHEQVYGPPHALGLHRVTEVVDGAGVLGPDGDFEEEVREEQTEDSCHWVGRETCEEPEDKDKATFNGKENGVHKLPDGCGV